jgi:predicted CXXCH cytochrome family protein
MFEAKDLKSLGLVTAGIIALLAAAIFSATRIEFVQASPQKQETEAYCLSCHSDPNLKITLPSGEELSLYISKEKLDHSIHSQAGIECEACHTQIKTFPHPEIEYQTKRELARSYYQACQKCHPSNYAKALDSIHASSAEAGNLNAPICTDCHGSHYVQPAGEPRTMISTTCGQCHEQIFSNYKGSVHGNALINENNQDVPVCTDCHGVHNIQDPRTSLFRDQSPDLCASCHANSDLMAKYGISSDVYSLYNLSWHGIDISIYRARWPTLWHNSAVCTDCHGVHDILAIDNPASTVNPANLLATCQKCHPDAGPNWTGAWVGHNRIDKTKTPFLFYTEQFYSSFVPIVLWLSILYVGLQIIHGIVGRVRRSLP